MQEEITIKFKMPKPGDKLPFTIFERNGKYIGYDESGDLFHEGFDSNFIDDWGLEFLRLLGVKFAISSASIVIADPT